MPQSIFEITYTLKDNASQQFAAASNKVVKGAEQQTTSIFKILQAENKYRDSINNSIAALQAEAKALSDPSVQKRIKEIDNLQKSNQALKNSIIGVKTETSKLNNALAQAGKLIAGLYVVRQTAIFYRDAAIAARDYEKSLVSLGALTKEIGMSSEYLVQQMQKSTRGMVSLQELTAISNRAIALLGEGAISQFPELAEAAAKSAQVMGTSVSKAFNDMIIGIGRQSRLILDNLGLIVSAEKANANYAKQLGITAEMLTETQRKQAFLNEALSQAQQKYRNITIMVDEVAAFEAQWADMRIELGRGVLPVLEEVSGSLSSMMQGIKDLNPELRTFVIQTGLLTTAIVALNSVVKYSIGADAIGGFLKLLGTAGTAGLIGKVSILLGLLYKLVEVLGNAGDAFVAAKQPVHDLNDEISRLIKNRQEEFISWREYNDIIKEATTNLNRNTASAITNSAISRNWKPYDPAAGFPTQTLNDMFGVPLTDDQRVENAWAKIQEMMGTKYPERAAELKSQLSGLKTELASLSDKEIRGLVKSIANVDDQINAAMLSLIGGGGGAGGGGGLSNAIKETNKNMVGYWENVIALEEAERRLALARKRTIDVYNTIPEGWKPVNKYGIPITGGSEFSAHGYSAMGIGQQLKEWTESKTGMELPGGMAGLGTIGLTMWQESKTAKMLRELKGGAAPSAWDKGLKTLGSNENLWSMGGQLGQVFASGGGAKQALSSILPMVGSAFGPVGMAIGSILGGVLGKERGSVPASPVYVQDVATKNLLTELLNITKIGLSSASAGRINDISVMLHNQAQRV